MPDSDIRDNPITNATTKPPFTGVADTARSIADQHPRGSVDRCAALVVAVAAREMSTPVRARALIVEHFADRPANADVGRAALALLDQLTTTMTTQTTGGTLDA